MPNQTVKMGRVARAADVRAASLDADARTIEVIVASETPVRRLGYLDKLGFGAFDEILSMDGVDVSRMSNAPLLDGHDTSSVSKVLGRVEGHRIEGGQMIATVKFSKKRAAAEAFQDIADGVLTQVSVGYRVSEYEISVDGDETPVARATAWQPHEVSLVPVGADPSAVVRAADDEADVAVKVIDAAADESAGDEAEAEASADEAAETDDETRSAEDADDSAGDEGEAEADDESGAEDGAAADPVAEARSSAAAITRAAAKAGFPDVAASLIESGASVADAEARFKELGEIRTLARKAGLRDLGEQLVKKGVSLAKAKDTLLSALVERADEVGEITSRPDMDSEAEAEETAAPRIDMRAIYARRKARA